MEDNIEFSLGNPVGRSVTVWYKSQADIKNHTPLGDLKLKYIEGEVVNFSPSRAIVLDGKEYGFNIIPYEAIVYVFGLELYKKRQ